MPDLMSSVNADVQQSRVHFNGKELELKMTGHQEQQDMLARILA